MKKSRAEQTAKDDDLEPELRSPEDQTKTSSDSELSHKSRPSTSGGENSSPQDMEDEEMIDQDRAVNLFHTLK